MSKYTTEVRFICETNSGLTDSVGYDNIDEVIEESRSKIFDFDFPIYDESYRSVLETKILKHYYTREIAYETVGLWKLGLNRKMNEIMPYYNELYKTTLYEINPTYDVDLWLNSNRQIGHDESTTSKSSGSSNQSANGSTTNSGNGNTSGDTQNSYSDTPQNGLEDVIENNYLTNFTHVVSSGSSSNSSQGTSNSNATTTAENDGSGTREYKNTDEYLEHIYGKRNSDSYAKLVKEWRKSIINIDMMIIDELQDLFFNLW